MKRRDFLKMLGVGAAVAAVVPSVTTARPWNIIPMTVRVPERLQWHGSMWGGSRPEIGDTDIVCSDQAGYDVWSHDLRQHKGRYTFTLSDRQPV